jgi:mono/diheme cytochrome c family protein
MKKALILLPFVIAALLFAQDLPEGNGKRLVQEICSGCHGLDVVVSQQATKEGWQSIIDYMIQRGASAKEDEIAIMVEYLAKNFGKEDKKK